MVTESNKTKLDLNEIDSDILIGKYELSIDEEGRRTIIIPDVKELPEIIIMKTIGNTRYTVVGSYAGNRNLEEKISQILKKDMEV